MARIFYNIVLFPEKYFVRIFFYHTTLILLFFFIGLNAAGFLKSLEMEASNL